MLYIYQELNPVTFVSCFFKPALVTLVYCKSLTGLKNPNMSQIRGVKPVVLQMSVINDMNILIMLQTNLTKQGSIESNSIWARSSPH